MIGLRPPRLVHQGHRGKALRRRSWLLWLALLGAAGGSLGMLTEWLPGADGPLTMLIALALLTIGTLMADHTRRRVIERAWVLDDGVLIETPGLFRPIRRVIPGERARLARVGPSDPRSSMRGMIEVRLRGELFSYLYDPDGGLIPFGEEKPRGRGRR